VSVHIGELRTEVVPGPPPDPPAGTPALPPEDLRREAWLARRVAAEGFDD
jgi:hypothetical protein